MPWILAGVLMVCWLLGLRGLLLALKSRHRDLRSNAVGVDYPGTGHFFAPKGDAGSEWNEGGGGMR
jgi:hypothetical protein